MRGRHAPPRACDVVTMLATLQLCNVLPLCSRLDLLRHGQRQLRGSRSGCMYALFYTILLTDKQSFEALWFETQHVAQCLLDRYPAPVVESEMSNLASKVTAWQLPLDATSYPSLHPTGQVDLLRRVDSFEADAMRDVTPGSTDCALHFEDLKRVAEHDSLVPASWSDAAVRL